MNLDFCLIPYTEIKSKLITLESFKEKIGKLEDCNDKLNQCPAQKREKISSDDMEGRLTRYRSRFQFL